MILPNCLTSIAKTKKVIALSLFANFPNPYLITNDTMLTTFYPLFHDYVLAVEVTNSFGLEKAILE